MNPEFVGQGRGKAFCSIIIRHIEENNKKTAIRLTVAKFNQRAIRLYENLGFKKEKEFQTYTAEFMIMVRRA